MTLHSAATTMYGATNKYQLSSLPRILYVSCAVIVAFSLFGCMASSSVSESSNSLSTSFNSSSKSFKSSSDERTEAYLFDIRQYTAAYTRANSDIAGLTQGLSTVSEKHGITNWEADNATFVGIGEGLAKAEVPQQKVALYLAALAHNDQTKIAAIQKGFSQGR